MKNIREYLSSAAGLIKAQGRVLSMVMTLLILSNCAWADYYLLGSSNIGLKSSEGTRMTESSGDYTYTFTFTLTSGVEWFRVYNNSDLNNSHCVYCNNCSSVDLYTNTNYNFTSTGTYTQYTIKLTEANTYTFTITSTGVLSVTAVSSATIPTVRIGNQIKKEDNNDVIVSGYVAKTGCAAISQFTVYYSKSPITDKNAQTVYKKEITVSGPAPGVGSLTDLTIPADEIATKGWSNEDMYVRITATNSKGESELSDEVILTEYSPQLSGTDITGLNFNDCEGSHQFNFSDMFKFNVDSWSAAVTDSEVDATSDFELTQEGYMVWNTSDKEAGDYSYTFTAYKSGSSATALLTFTYSAKAKLNDITIVSGETPTYPYIKIELECSVGGSVNDIKWSVDNNGLVVRTGIGTAYFKGKAVNKSTTYTISAVGLSDTCGETEPKTIEIVVNPEPEEVCTAN